MSDLQLSLIGAGVAAVAAVWAYNLWQEKKAHRTAEAMLKRLGRTEDDALLDASGDPGPTGEGDDCAAMERIEPTFSAAPLAVDTVAEDSAAALPSFVEDNVTERGTVMAASSQPSALPPQWVDDLVDCILWFTTAEPVPAPAVWTLQAAWAGDMTKPMYWLACDEAENAWRGLDGHETGHFRQWAVTLQLVDRRGAVSDGELARFFDGVEQVVDAIGATLELPARRQIALNAVALDEFCAGVDIQFKFHIVEAAGGVFSGTKLRGVAEALGLVLEPDGAFHARDAEQGELFALSNLGDEGFSVESLRTLVTHGLTLSIDVPRIKEGAAVFTRMLAAGGQLARALDGVLVDAQRTPLSDAMIAAIRAKIIELQQRMRDAGIDPGSTRALRLFS